MKPITDLDGHTVRQEQKPSTKQREWQGLREEDWEHIDNKKGTLLDTFDQGAAWAQARLKERNT